CSRPQPSPQTRPRPAGSTPPSTSWRACPSAWCCSPRLPSASSPSVPTASCGRSSRASSAPLALARVERLVAGDVVGPAHPQLASARDVEAVEGREVAVARLPAHLVAHGVGMVHHRARGLLHLGVADQPQLL